MAIPILLEDQMQMERYARAEAALANGEMTVTLQGDNQWMVRSKNNTYTVSWDGEAWACTCPDFADRCQRFGLRCKHVEAVRLTEASTFVDSVENKISKSSSVEDPMKKQANSSLQPDPQVARELDLESAPESEVPPSELEIPNDGSVKDTSITDVAIIDGTIERLRQPLDMSRAKRRQAPSMGTVPYLEGFGVPRSSRS
jgi:predicted nucleic acid-binding Zn finger protein